MTGEVKDWIKVKECSAVKFGMDTKIPQSQTSDATQAAPAAYTTGAFGLNSDVNMQALYDLIIQIRTTLVNNGMMKGAA